MPQTDDGFRGVALPDFGQQRRTVGNNGQKLVEQARETARQMIAQAQQRIEADREAARAAGFEEGYREGLESADRDAAGVVRAAEEVAASVIEHRASELEALESEIVELAIHLSDRIVAARMEADPEMLLDIFRGALRRAFHRETVHVLANPDDMDMLRSFGPGIAAELGGVEHLHFVEERRVARGGVVVRTPAGEVEATLEGKRDKLVAALREVAQQRHASGAASSHDSGAACDDENADADAMGAA